jgi:hypothetical protein
MGDHPKNIEELRADFEARQSNLLPFDSRRSRVIVNSPFWTNGDGMPWGQLALALFFLFLASGLVAIPILKDFEDATLVAWIVAVGPLILSLRLFRDVFQRVTRAGPGPGDQGNPMK